MTDQAPQFDPDGTVRVPAFALPPSALSSEQAQAQQRQRALMPASPAQSQEPDIAVRRAQIDAMILPRISLLLAQYPVEIVDGAITGVRVKTFTSSASPTVPDRVLINLHGGGFSVGWEGCALVESIPISAVGGYKVVSVDYRMAPEFKHPAAVEDIVAVYTDLLKTYAPSQIGIFGGSAGGALTAQTAAWLAVHGLPQAGAIGIFGAGAMRFDQGDSHQIAAAIDGTFGPPTKPGELRPDITAGYFDGAEMDGPIISAAKHSDVIARFPPTLIITGTRAMDLSPAIYTNSALLKAGVRSTLIVGEAMGHCYYYTPELPESQDAYAAIVAHFREHLR
jgi:acetyl esterase/lipase